MGFGTRAPVDGGEGTELRGERGASSARQRGYRFLLEGVEEQEDERTGQSEQSFPWMCRKTRGSGAKQGVG